MKTFFSLALVAMMALLTACPSPTDAAIGTISGTITVAPTLTLDMSGARVAIYRSFEDLVDDEVLKSVTLSGSGSQWTFTMNDVTPGSYYLDICKAGIGCIAYTGSGTQPALVPVEGGKITRVTITLTPQ